VRGINADVVIADEDPTRVRNRANYQRLEAQSAALLERAIRVMKAATFEDCERLELRCANWGDEKDLVRSFIEASIDPDNWELVQFGEPWIEERGEQPRCWTEAKPDSLNDCWPQEKLAIYDFVTENVTPENRHLVKLLNPEELYAIKAKRRPKIVQG
jgi:hypothetical protein